MKQIIEVPSAPFAATEIKSGLFVAARVSHRSHNTVTGNTTAVYEAVKRNGEKVKGTKSQIVKACDPYSRKGDAAKLATKANTEPALV